jgi:hypothetical protein
MSKGNFFLGQPVFSQLLKLIPRTDVQKSAKAFSSDHYCKVFLTYEHLTVMLYAIFNRCTSLREVTTGIMACYSKLFHLGLDHTVRRSTLSDANRRRTFEVFEDIYKKLYARYAGILSDSQSGNRKKLKGRLYIIDSTTISLFQEILKAAGRNPVNGKRKGGIKAHTLVKADEDVPQMVRFSAAAANDVPFMKAITVSKGSILVFDKAYRDYRQLNRWDEQGIFWVSRLHRNTVVQNLYEKELTDHHQKQGVLSDSIICIGHNHHDKIEKVQCRLVKYYDQQHKRNFEFITNHLDYSPVTIANLYKQRWQIETLFKRIKQNYPLRNFLGDSENAIKIQIWCALIADLLLKVIKSRCKKQWSFANLASMVRLHLMTYINLISFLNKPEKSLLQSITKIEKWKTPQLFPT